MSHRYISNDIPLQPLGAEPRDLLRATLDQLVRDIPPPSSSDRRTLSGGLFSGYTGLATAYRKGHKAIEWAKRYLGKRNAHAKLEKGCCGIGSERLSYDAVKACITKDPSDVAQFLTQINHVVQASNGEDGKDDPFPCELANGRAGTLYLLRMVKHWVKEATAELDKAMETVAAQILATDDGEGNWEWHGKRYFGAAHGDIGIITQIVLSVPSMAPKVSKKLEELLDSQLDDGNFPSSSRSLERGKADLVQWCHGATGFIYSLQALRPYFRELHTRINEAISKAQNLVWSKGLLVKQPCLCHGIFGNALVLPPGEQRDHFLSLATPSSVHQIRQQDPNMFVQASYGKDTSVLMNYLPSAAWTWLVSEEDEPSLIMYTDI